MIADPSLFSIRLPSIRKSLLFVSAHRPGPWLSCTQLPRTSAPLTAQNLTPPVQPQPSIFFSQSPVLLAAISLPSTTSPVIGVAPENAFIPYCPFWRRQFPRIC